MKFLKIIFTGLIFITGSAVAQQNDNLELECFLEPSMVVHIGTPVPGVLSSVTAERGKVVRKNTVLAKIDSRVQQAAVNLARVRVEFAKRRISRNDELFNDGLVSSQERDEIITESKLAELELQERLVQLEIRSIKSPVNGVVVERVRSPGDFVQETEILKIAQINPLNVEVIVPVEYFGRIVTGTNATVSPQAPVGGSHAAKVSVVDKVVDAASGTFRVRLQIPNKDLKIPAGLRCNVDFSFTE